MSRNNSSKTVRGRALTRRELEDNRRQLAAKIAQARPDRAIYAPPGCLDLREMDAPTAAMFPVEVSKMTREAFAKIDNGTINTRKYAQLSDGEVCLAHADYMADPALTVKAVAKKYNTTDTTLHIRWRKMGLDTKPRGAAVLAKKEQATNGDGKPFAAAFEEYVGAPTLSGGDKLSPPEPEEMAVPAKVTAPAAVEPEAPPDYGILYGLIGLLPASGRWTQHEKLLWLNAVEAVLRLCVKEVVEGRVRP